jgi:hypothetical protein
MKYTKIMTTTAAIAIILLSTSYANAFAQIPALPPLKEHAELTPQQQQLSQCSTSELNSLPPLAPGALPICAGSPLLKGAPFNPPRMPLPPGVVPGQAAEKIMQQVQHRLAAASRGTTQAQIFQQMTNEGLINCPAITNPNHICWLNPPSQLRGPIAPPIAP